MNGTLDGFPTRVRIMNSRLGAWVLELLWMLDVGCWSFFAARFNFLALMFLISFLSVHANTITSPDGNVATTVSVNSDNLTYSITYRGTPVIESSPLGFTVNNTNLG